MLRQGEQMYGAADGLGLGMRRGPAAHYDNIVFGTEILFDCTARSKLHA